MFKPTYRIFIYQSFAYLFFDRAIFTIFLLQHGVSAAMIGVLQSILWIATAVTEIPMGHLGDRIGRKKMIFLGRGLTIGYFLLMAFGDGLFYYICSFILLGIGEACISGCDSALLYETSRNDYPSDFDFSKISGRFSAVTSVSLAVAMGLAGYLLFHSWTMVYLASITAHLVALVFLLTVPETISESQNKDSGEPRFMDLMLYLKDLAKESKLAVFILGMCLYGSAGLTLFIFAPMLLSIRGGSEIAISYLMMIVTLLTSMGAMLAWRARKKFGIQVLFTYVPMVLATIIVLFSICPWYISAVLFALGYTIETVLDPLFSKLLNDNLPDRLRAGALSVFNLSFSVFAILMFPVASFLVDFVSVEAACIFLAAIIGISSLMTSKIPKNISAD